LNEFRKNQTKSQIIAELQKTPKMTREELSDVLGIKKGTLYRHLASLEKAGVLKRKREGHCLRYEVAEKTLLAIRK
ncbi:MAG TPA: winged helix-turn-helix domain-containing protein, partial [Methanocorpusculum sp.]|nr:winged helix-turn-helix domain-containing protein [Methanocorpusculum sp.]